MGSRARSGAGKILSPEKTWRKRRRCESKQVDSGLRTFGTAEIKISLLRSGSFSFGKNRRAYRQALYGDRSGVEARNRRISTGELNRWLKEVDLDRGTSPA